MHAHQIYSCVVAVLLASGVLAAPLQNKQALEKRDAPVQTPLTPKVDEQEAELEQLVSLAGQQTKDNNVAVHESHVSHYENKNGEQIKVEQTEQKVTDTNTGKVIADIKQEVTDGSDADKVTKTEVDIPDKGIHETFVKDEVVDDVEDQVADEESSDERQENVGFSPSAVAEYLMKTREFDNFEAALKDLVSSLIMSEDEAEEYEEQVLTEYQRMLSEQEALSRIFVDEDPMQGYYPGYPEADKRSSVDAIADELPQDLYELDPAYDNYLGGNDVVLDKQEDDSLAGIIDALLNAWWEQDLEGGNPRAQALVSYLYDIVSRDTNPDDIGQIRDILADMLANALLEDVQNAEADYKIEKALSESSSDVDSRDVDISDVDISDVDSRDIAEEQVQEQEESEEKNDTEEEELAKLSKTEETKEEDVQKELVLPPKEEDKPSAAKAEEMKH